MGVYIKGMEMPESCGRCYMFSFLSDSCRLTNHVTEEMNDKMFDRRFEDCPLVPVPPHGRLIDADVAEVISYSLEDSKGNFADGILFAADWISEQPTIIEAEEGEI